MRCPKCGMEIITDVSTCPNCGNYLPMSPMQAGKKKKSKSPAKLGFAIGAVAVAAAVGGGFFVTNSMADARYAKQLELGRQYYETGDYEAAQVAYNKALSMRADSEEAMLGLSKTYLETGDVESAQEWYDRFEEEVGDVETSTLTASVRSDYESLTSELSEYVVEDSEDDGIGYGYSDEDLAVDEENPSSSTRTVENDTDTDAKTDADSDFDPTSGDDLVENTGEDGESEENDEGKKSKKKDSKDDDKDDEKSEIDTKTNEDTESSSKDDTKSDSKASEEDTASIDDERIEKAKDSYILPDSDQVYYSEEELSGLSTEVLVYALCEIYARRGQIFDSEDLTTWFESFDWYHARTENEEDVSKYFSDEEKENVSLIKKLLEEQGYDFGKDTDEVSVSDVLTAVLDVITKNSDGDTEKSSTSTIYTALLDHMEDYGSLEEGTSSSSSKGTSLDPDGVKSTTTTPQTQTQTYTPSYVEDDEPSYTYNYYEPSYYEEPVYSQPQYQETYTPSYSYDDSYDSGIGYGYSDDSYDDHSNIPSNDYEYDVSGGGSDGGSDSFDLTIE